MQWEMAIIKGDKLEYFIVDILDQNRLTSVGLKIIGEVKHWQKIQRIKLNECHNLDGEDNVFSVYVEGIEEMFDYACLRELDFSNEILKIQVILV